MHGDSLDEMDQRILDVIREHARMTYRDIGEAVGLSRIAVKNRMCAMEEAGIILGYRTEINGEARDAGIRFQLDIEAEPEHMRELCDYLAGEKMIRKIWILTGNSHIGALGTAGNQKMLDYLVRSIMRSLTGVRHISCHTILAVLMDRDGGVGYGDGADSDPGVEKRTDPRSTEVERRTDPRSSPGGTENGRKELKYMERENGKD